MDSFIWTGRRSRAKKRRDGGVTRGRRGLLVLLDIVRSTSSGPPILFNSSSCSYRQHLLCKQFRSVLLQRRLCSLSSSEFSATCVQRCRRQLSSSLRRVLYVNKSTRVKLCCHVPTLLHSTLEGHVPLRRRARPLSLQQCRPAVRGGCLRHQFSVVAGILYRRPPMIRSRHGAGALLKSPALICLSGAALSLRLAIMESRRDH